MSALTGGKLKLVQAALTLITQSRSLTSLGLRELAREAGLNPNTFYRHFRNLDEFGLSVLAFVAEEMNRGVRELRRMAENSDQAVTETVAFVYAYFLDNPAATTIAVRELHGASPLLRQALESQLDASAQEMAEDIVDRKLVSGLTDSVILDISQMTIRYILFRAMDYLEKPDQRLSIRQETERFINRQFRGAQLEHLAPADIARLVR